MPLDEVEVKVKDENSPEYIVNEESVRINDYSAYESVGEVSQEMYQELQAKGSSQQTNV